MSLIRVAMLIAVIVVIIGLGCDAVTTTAIGGVYDVGTVDFNFGGGEFWRLHEVELVVDTTERWVHFSGFSDGALWAWAGSYTRSGDRIAATGLPEIYFGSDDLLDLHLEFSAGRFEGVAINWDYVGRDLANIGAARIDGRRTTRIIPRSAPSEEQEKRQPKYDDPDLL